MSLKLTFLTEVGNVTGLSLNNNKAQEKYTNISTTVSLTLVVGGAIPLNSSYSLYKHDIISNISMHLTIDELTTGQDYFVRVSVENELRHGKHRTTAPLSLATSVQKPGQPTSFDHDLSPPVLSAISATSLLVQIGPPVYDGGSPLTYFVVE